jgi:HprK-related kinase A
VLLPAVPGSGKTTLTAALVSRGFRLLSDEFGVVSLRTGMVLPLVRPPALKNASIDIIKAFAPGVALGPSFPGTRKGTVAHVAPNRASVDARHIPARPLLVIFPRYEQSAQLHLDPVPKSRAFTRLAINSFNYSMLGLAGFHAVGALLQQASCYQLVYRDLEPAVAAIRELADGAARSAAVSMGTSGTASIAPAT